MKNKLKLLKLKLQNLRIHLGKKILDGYPQKKQLTLTQNNINAILFIRKDGKIGDYIVSSFALREIKKANKNIKIGVVCATKNIELFENNQYIDNLYLVREKNILDFIRVGLKIAKSNYDIVIDPAIFIRNRDLLLLRIINTSHYIGYKKQHYKIFNMNISDNNYHYRDIYRISLEMCGFKDINCDYIIPYKKENSDNIENFLLENKIKDYISINFFGAANARKFTKENIQNYLDYLSKTIPNQKVILLTYPQVTDLLTTLIKPYDNIFLYAKTESIYDSIEIIRHSKLVISPDTAIIHIASGFNKNIIGFYKNDIQGLNNWQPISQGEVNILYYQHNINEISPEQLKIEWLENN